MRQKCYKIRTKVLLIKQLHLQNIFKTGELEQNLVTQKIRITANDGKKLI